MFIIKRGIVLIVIFFLIFAPLYYFKFYSKSCDSTICLEGAAKTCSKASLLLEETGGTLTRYTIKGKEGQTCNLEIKIERVPTLTDETRASFEGKSMTCIIPREEFSRMTAKDMGSKLDYCTGPLKEAMYDVLIKKLYNLVIKDMSSVLKEIERQL